MDERVERAGESVSLGFGIGFADLYTRTGLLRVDEAFGEGLRAGAAPLHERLLAAQANPGSLAAKAESELIIALAPFLEDFIGALFGIGPELRALQARHVELAPLFAVKRRFVQQKVNRVTAEAARAIDGTGVRAALEGAMGEPLTEMAYGKHVAAWLDKEAEHAAELGLAAQYAAWAVLTPEGKAAHREGVLFKLPRKLDMLHLVPVETVQLNGTPQFAFGEEHHREREGFELTDHGTDLVGALDQASYCVKCHHQAKDSCAKGLRLRAI